MFRSKRSGLVRRIWRSRLVTYNDGEDGSKRSEAGWDGSCGTNPEKIHQTGHRSVTRGDTSQGTFREVWGENPTDIAEQEGQFDHGQDAMCVPELRGSQLGQDSDSRTVTCCLFRERDIRHRIPDSALRKERGTSCQCSSSNAQLVAISHPVVEEELKNVTYTLLKKLKEKPLDALLKAIESKGGVTSECVLVPQTVLWLGGHPISPQYLLCKLYRWHDIQHTAQLKALCLCQSFGAADNAKVCCNPYHHSRLCGPESPPPPYSLSSDQHKPLDLCDSTLPNAEAVVLHSPGSPPIMPRNYTDTSLSLGSSTSGGQGSSWCSVAYWEQRTRVGRLYPAHEPSLSIFYDLPQGTGLCLGQLHGNAHGNQRGANRGPASSCVQQTRRKIGHGIVLSREPDGVWLYNRSLHPVFVHSATLDLPGTRGLSVRRVMPGYSLKVFDYERSSWVLEHNIRPECQEGPWDPHSVRISFAKGWGPCYSRQFITSCPCWLEVLLNNHR